MIIKKLIKFKNKKNRNKNKKILPEKNLTLYSRFSLQAEERKLNVQIEETIISKLYFHIKKSEISNSQRAVTLSEKSGKYCKCSYLKY